MNIKHKWSRRSIAERAGVKETTMHSRILRKRILEKLGSKCSRCGITDWRVLQIDHVDGNGNSERKSLGGVGFQQAVLRGDSNCQLLCANCHQIRHFELRGYLDPTVPYKKGT